MHTTNVIDISDVPSVEHILHTDSDWEKIFGSSEFSNENLEKLLRKIHLLRKPKTIPEQRQRIVEFLISSYRSTNDIRFFNEFLWYNDLVKNDQLKIEGEEIFSRNINAEGFHSLPTKISEVKMSVNDHFTASGAPSQSKIMKICLIGFPPFFGELHRKLSTAGHEVKQFFIPYHPNKLIHWLLQQRPLVKALSLFRGNAYPYETLPKDIKDPLTRKILEQQAFDVGFHKLNFIIRENIYGAFRWGLINDHWGYLPMLRGRSTIAFSKLLNIPVISTFHLITKGIDEGPIVGYCQVKQIGSPNDLRKEMRQSLADRAFAAIQAYCKSGFALKKNNLKDGLTFYEMHPWLRHYTNKLPCTFSDQKWIK